MNNTLKLVASVSGETREMLSPVWMETLAIKNAKIYGNIESVKNNPPLIALEVWNAGKTENVLIGRHIIKPEVFLISSRLQPPSYPPKPQWLNITSNGHLRGEILVMFELLQIRDEAPGGERESAITSIPDYIKLTTVPYKLEVLFWGVRESKSLPLSDLKNPKVTLNCGSTQLSSFSLKDPTVFPNFSEPTYIADLELPEDWIFAPPFVLRLFDNRTFGTKVFIGSHISRNLQKFVMVFSSKTEWIENNQPFPIPRKSTFYGVSSHSIIVSLPPEMKPLVDLKHNVKSKPPLLAIIESRRTYYKLWKFICSCCKRKKKEPPGYVSLGSIDQEKDDDDEEFFDWWTKYFESLHWNNTNNEKKEAFLKQAKLDVENTSGLPFLRKTTGIHIYSSELEDQFNNFEDVIHTFKLTKSSSKGENDAGNLKVCLALYKSDTEGLITSEGYSPEVGIFSGVAAELGAITPLTVRVYVVRAYQLNTKDKLGKVNPFIEVFLPGSHQLISDSKNVITHECNPIFGKIYKLKARLPFDSNLVIRVMSKGDLNAKELIGETVIDLENRYYSQHRATCGLQRAYAKEGYNAWRDVQKPSEILKWSCSSHNLPPPQYETNSVVVAGIRFTSLQNNKSDFKEHIALKALLNWEKIPVCGCKLVEEHVETRSLYSTKRQPVERGKLEMWVDLFPGNVEPPPPVDIRPRKPEKYELRVIVWSTVDVKFTDKGTMVGKENTDIFVKGWLKGKQDMQTTDIHFASLTGEGQFNWRFKFEFSYDREEKMLVFEDFSDKVPPILTLQVYDHERIFPDEYLGQLSLNLLDIAPPSSRFLFNLTYLPRGGRKRNIFKDRYIRGWWPFISSLTGKKEKVGMVDLEISLLTSNEAERNPAGFGRNEPDALPAPVRPIVKYTVWIVPFRAIKNYIWNYHKKALFKALFIISFAFFLAVFIYSFPNYSVKKIMAA